MTVIEIEEFVALRNAKSANEAKPFLSKLSDRIRIPYEKYATDVPRTCIFIETLDERTFLNDHTGERRYLPVECNPNKRGRTIFPDENNKEKFFRQRIYCSYRRRF
ncbi:VapE domain-containing protein [Globicatella sulfidifaciens]